ARDKQQIGNVEYEPANKGVKIIRKISTAQVGNKTFAARAQAAHGQSDAKGGDQNTNHVVPVEQLKAVVPGALVSVGPRSPEYGAHHSHGECYGEGTRSKHVFRSIRPACFSAGVGNCRKMTCLDGFLGILSAELAALEEGRLYLFRRAIRRYFL